MTTQMKHTPRLTKAQITHLKNAREDGSIYYNRARNGGASSAACLERLVDMGLCTRKRHYGNNNLVYFTEFYITDAGKEILAQAGA